MSDLITSLTGNQVFAGMLAAGGIGALAFWLKGAGKALSFVLLRQWTVEMEVRNEDPAFDWLANWLAHQDYARRTRRLRLASRGSGEAPAPSGSAGGALWMLSPGLGMHWFFFGGRPVWLSRTQAGDKAVGTAKIPETITLRTVGRSQAALRRIVDDARDLMERKEGVEIYIWRPNYWCFAGMRNCRAIDTVILPVSQMDRILHDAEWFFGAKDWYAARGAPYRRGYLFSGVPGSGKTSLVQALASRFNRPVHVLNMGAVWGDGAILEAMAGVNSRAILLIEDIDAAQRNRDPQAGAPKRPEDEAGYVSMSALLNAIDGVTAADGRLLIMTTNYADRLDSALVRGGRVDLHERFGLAGPDEMRRIFELFYPGQGGHVAAFRTLRPRSPADLQAIFMRHADDPDGALAELQGDAGATRAVA